LSVGPIEGTIAPPLTLRYVGPSRWRLSNNLHHCQCAGKGAMSFLAWSGSYRKAVRLLSG